MKARILSFLDTVGVLSLFWKRAGFFKTRNGYLYLSPNQRLSGWFRRFDCWEPYVCYGLPKEIRPGDKVLELGSCLGYFSIALAELVGDQGKVAGLEPCQNYFSHLRRVWSKNRRYRNRLQFLNLAAGAKDETFCFDSTKTHYEMLSEINSIEYACDGNQSRVPEEMQMRTAPLEQIIAKIGFMPDVIFMDIEGGELEVFDQMIQLGIRPKVIFEHHVAFYGQQRFDRVLQRLRDYGYREKWTDPDHLVLTYYESPNDKTTNGTQAERSLAETLSGE